jgi:hypothetical protein
MRISQAQQQQTIVLQNHSHGKLPDSCFATHDFWRTAIPTSFAEKMGASA